MPWVWWGEAALRARDPETATRGQLRRLASRRESCSAAITYIYAWLHTVCILYIIHYIVGAVKRCGAYALYALTVRVARAVQCGLCVR
jgi:hypothetical protein